MRQASGSSFSFGEKVAKPTGDRVGRNYYLLSGANKFANRGVKMAEDVGKDYR
jgi:hypothetical protein